MKRMFVQSGLALVGITGQLLLPFQVKAASPCRALLPNGAELNWECPKPEQCDFDFEYDDKGRVTSMTGTCI